MLSALALVASYSLVAHQCATPEGLSTSCDSTSIVRILADPSTLHGQWVRTTGYVVLEFEGMRICLDEASAKSFIPENCLWLNLSQDLVPAENGSRRNGGLQKACSFRYVLVEGYVNSKSRGHMGAYAASLDRVSRLLGHPLLVDLGQRYHGCSFEAPPET